MNIIVHDSPYIDSIFHIPVELYKIEHDFNFRGSPSLHEHIILNRGCAVITFTIDDQVLTFDTNIVCGKFTRPPKINILFKKNCKKLTVIRLNAYGMFKLTDIPVASMVNRITPSSLISLDLCEEAESEQALTWIEGMMKREVEPEAFHITREIIHYIDANFSDLPSNVNKTVARQFGLSESTLQRYFKKYIGLNLSTYMLTLKRKKMIDSVCRDHYSSLVVQENGYFDQAHFINDFKRLFGMSLKEYFHEMKLIKQHTPDFVRFLYHCDTRQGLVKTEE